jgi:hypothetical protein
MDVVRHDDELAQLVTFTRKIPKRILHHFTYFGGGQCTLTVTGVEPIVDSTRKTNGIITFLRGTAREFLSQEDQATLYQPTAKCPPAI